MPNERTRVLGLCVAAFALACSSDERVLGEQCPSPYVADSGATLARGAEPSTSYGTSCAPCDADDLRLDDRGCPIYVTFESCGGDICLGDVLVRQVPDEDEDAGAEDGGGEEDSGTEEDGGD